MNKMIRIICYMLSLGVSTFSWAQDTGIYTRVNIALSQVDASAVERALYKHFPILSQTNTRLVLAHEIESPGGFHYTFDQYIEGIPIHHGGIKANLNKSGMIISCMNYLADFETNITSSFHLSAEYFRQEVARELETADVSISQSYVVQDRQLIAAYHARIYDKYSGLNEERIYHADTGTMLQQEDLNSYFARVDSSGSGKVFIPNPCTKAQVAYGDLFVDAEDANLPIFDELMDTVELRDIQYRAGLFRLEGPYVFIEDILGPEKTPAVSIDGNFYFDRSQSGFEDVMAYYHIDTFQRYIQRLGFTNLQNKPFRVDTHGSTSDNSAFVPNGENSYIRFGEGGVDDAEDADVIIHEYGHALSNAASPGSLSGFERKALDEGVGDYLTASYSKDITLFDWYKLFNWDGYNEFWMGRDAATTETYPPESRDIYSYGQIWASSLMRIREEIGAEIADRLAIQELYSNAISMSLADGIQLLLDADTLLYEGKYANAINFYTCQSALRNDPICLQVDLSAPTAEKYFEIFPNPNTGRFQVSFSPVRNNMQVEIYTLMGQLVKRVQLTAKISSIKLSVAEGLYVVKLIQENQILEYRKMMIRR